MCLKALDVLKVLAATEWGADSTVLLQLYRALVRSKLDYGSIVYVSARNSYCWGQFYLDNNDRGYGLYGGG